MYAPDPLRLQLTVPEANVAVITQDMPVKFTVTAFGDKPFTGGVKYISPNVRESTRDLVVEAVVPNADLQLKPGMFAVAKIALGEKPHAVVPKEALLQDESGARAFAVVSGAIQERMVQTGVTVGDFVEVDDGLKVGDTVVVAPGTDVRDGARVE
jgi:membrane fusion protein (multidrug efflux system)